MTAEDYDIYITAHVDELKSDYEKLWQRYCEVVHENAELHARIDRMTRRHEEDYCYLTD